MMKPRFSGLLCLLGKINQWAGHMPAGCIGILFLAVYATRKFSGNKLPSTTAVTPTLFKTVLWHWRKGKHNESQRGFSPSDIFSPKNWKLWNLKKINKCGIMGCCQRHSHILTNGEGELQRLTSVHCWSNTDMLFSPHFFLKRIECGKWWNTLRILY